jgi:hypothetical protein
VQNELKTDTSFKNYSFFLKCLFFRKRAREGWSISSSLVQTPGRGWSLKPRERSGAVWGEVVLLQFSGHASAIEWGRAFDIRATGRGLLQSLVVNNTDQA